jgi:hypothetical protein
MVSKTRKVYRKPKHCKATMYGIHVWYKSMFEQLGWMVLADKKGYTDKIISYKSSILRLHDALEYKMKHVSEKDRKDDLRIMQENLMILHDHVDKDF